MNRSTRLVVAAAAALVAATLMSACASVQPWERGKLANPCMMFDPSGGFSAFDAHWQTAREAASGGFGVQGGGCGCTQ